MQFQDYSNEQLGVIWSHYGFEYYWIIYHLQYMSSSDEKEEEKPYGCPCGKKYLSYPALFTHVRQKHDGKAPGNLIKPKTNKTRGRPKIHMDIPEEDLEQTPFNFRKQLQMTIRNVVVSCSKGFRQSDGKVSCQDMATSFYNSSDFLSQQQKTSLESFISLLQLFVTIKLGDKFWKESPPSELIDYANEICHFHQQHKSDYPFPQKTLVSLVFILFTWMYKNHWTDHKISMKEPEELIQ